MALWNKRKHAGATKAGVHPVDEVLPPGPMVAYGLQHVLSMYAGVVAVPLIIGTALELTPQQTTYLISAGLFMSGLATLLQTIGVWRIGARLPLVQGTSFAAVSTMLAIGAPLGGEAGLRAIFGALIVAGAIAFFIAPFFTRLLRFFPPVVTGTVITVIGVSLLPVAIRWARGTANTPEFGSMRNIGLAAATLLIIVLIYRFLGGFFNRVAILLGLVLGTLVAIPFAATDFGRIGDAAAFQLTEPFHFGTPTFAVGAIVSMLVVMLVIMTETTADILAIGEVVDKPLGRRDVTGGLQADMLATTVAGVFNGFSVSAFAQNVGLVAVTGIKSRFVVAVSGVILFLLGLFPVLGALVALVPLPVLGGAGLVLFGTVAASGIRTLAKVDYDGNANLVIVAAAIGMGIIPIAVPEFYDSFPSWFQVVFDSGISAAAITAILLNLLFNVRRGQPEEAPIFAEAPAIGTTFEGDAEGIAVEHTDTDHPTPTRSRLPNPRATH
ncbi:purine permease [Geodermatophilus sp. TF02-6]|uniref:nucleobase:cation symporter-2 family protein n=1 Tax=Geodermatophilus sp. TF02-6 TaxID=2250575 RepID=UPI000DEB45CB|nr:nucleobase:cation symporter-2 family protein [Geodermatophilus sp. TF02-6]RBY76818.1 purine permease [Geodermatophilus sp. TF02-6]